MRLRIALPRSDVNQHFSISSTSSQRPALVQSERRTDVELRERVLHLVPVVELRGGRDDRLERKVDETCEPLQRIGDPLVLRRDLGVVGEILEPAAAAGRVVRTRRVDTLRPGSDDLGGERLGMTALNLRHARLDGVSRQAAADEDDEPVQASDAVPAVRERLDRELELLVTLNGGSHARRLAIRPRRAAAGGLLPRRDGASAPKAWPPSATESAARPVPGTVTSV